MQSGFQSGSCNRRTKVCWMTNILVHLAIKSWFLDGIKMYISCNRLKLYLNQLLFQFILVPTWKHSASNVNSLAFIDRVLHATKHESTRKVQESLCLCLLDKSGLSIEWRVRLNSYVDLLNFENTLHFRVVVFSFSLCINTNEAGTGLPKMFPWNLFHLNIPSWPYFVQYFSL